jgi:hypothetical protein
VLFVGNDWAEDHHDLELVDEGRPPAGSGPAGSGWMGCLDCMR